MSNLRRRKQDTDRLRNTSDTQAQLLPLVLRCCNKDMAAEFDASICMLVSCAAYPCILSCNGGASFSRAESTRLTGDQRYSLHLINQIQERRAKAFLQSSYPRDIGHESDAFKRYGLTE